MKINKSIEPAIYVLCILALQKGHTPVKSSTMSDIMPVSDSYLKKVLHKMVQADLIQSNASKKGGFQLKRHISNITLLDVFQALELDKEVFALQHIGRSVFPDDLEHATSSEQLVQQTFQMALEAFSAELAKITIDKLLRQDYLSEGKIDWGNNNN